MAKTQSEDSGRNCTLPLWSLRFFSIRDWEPEVLRCNLISPFLPALWPQAASDKDGRDKSRIREDEGGVGGVGKRTDEPSSKGTGAAEWPHGVIGQLDVDPVGYNGLAAQHDRERLARATQSTGQSLAVAQRSPLSRLPWGLCLAP